MTFKTIHGSDLYWRVYDTKDINDKYILVKMKTYYKADASPCEWLPLQQYRIIKDVYKYWKDYEVDSERLY